MKGDPDVSLTAEKARMGQRKNGLSPPHQQMHQSEHRSHSPGVTPTPTPAPTSLLRAEKLHTLGSRGP